MLSTSAEDRRAYHRQYWFDSMYGGSLYGKWQAIITFQQMIVLADIDGVLDRAPEWLSATTSIPLDIITEGIKILQSPDPQSRTPDEEGRRIVLLDPARSWGWRIVNHKKYRVLRNAEDRRAYHRQYWQDNRSNQPAQPDSTGLNSNSTDSTATQQNQPIAEAEAEAMHCASKNDALPGFDNFWKAYPRKKSKGNAKKAWKKLKPNEQLQNRILRALEQAKTSVDWLKEGGQFIPYPASWLNAEGWEDRNEDRPYNPFAGAI